MGMNKNTVLAYATIIMIVVGLGMIALGAFKYDEVAGYGFGAVGIGFFAIAWVFNALKGRVWLDAGRSCKDIAVVLENPIKS